MTYTLAADSLAGLGSHEIGIQSVAIAGEGYPTGGEPSFEIDVSERRYAHGWSYGAVRKASAGVSSGLIAYVQAETNGGMGLTLHESDAESTDDDQVTMKQTYSAVAGGGIGAGLRENISANASLNAELTTEASLRPFGSLEARFNRPYADGDRKAQGVFLLLSVYDSATGYPSQPLVVSMLQAGEAELGYLDYVAAQSAGVAAQWTPAHANVGADLDLGAKLGENSLLKDVDLSFTLLDAGVTYLVTAIVTDYGPEYGVSFEDELAIDLTTLSPDIPGIQNRLVGLLGSQARHVRKEYIYDAATDQLQRIEVTLSSEGSSSAYTDVAKKQVAVKLVLTGSYLTRSLVESVGETETVAGLEALLTSAAEVPYEVLVQDGSSTGLVPELTVPGTEIKVGMGLEVESLRSLVREHGAFVDGSPYVTESYAPDGYVAEAGQSWTDLTSNALGGLWLLVEDAFNWVGQRVESGAAWALEVYASTREGVRQGWARLSASPGAQLQAASAPTAAAPAIPTLQQADPITVTATGWVPQSSAALGALTANATAATASGERFVVGGIYDFQPYSLTISPSATLLITYTEEAANAVTDESEISLFRWNAVDANWQPVPAELDEGANTVTSAVAQLGTYALGRDATPPEIATLYPADGTSRVSVLPFVRVLVTDAGAGIDPEAVEIKLDQETVNGTYIAGTGELTYQPEVPLATGVHTLTVTAEDVMGHATTASSAFTVGSWVYLPTVLRAAEGSGR